MSGFSGGSGSGSGGGGGASAVDAAVFTLSSSSFTPTGFDALETGVSNMTAGTAGVARMTLDRRQITASHVMDRTTFADGSGWVSICGAVVDEGGITSVIEQQGGYFRMGSDRILYVRIMGGSIASGSPDSGYPTKIGLVFNSTKPTLTTGQRVDAQANVNGALDVNETLIPQYEDNTYGIAAVTHKPLPVSTYSPTRFQNIGANATLNVKATTGNVFSVYCHNLAGGDRWFQIHNTATTPAGAAVPALSFYIPPGGVLEKGNDFFTLAGLNFATGIAFAFSTTEGTYTAATATEHFSQLNFV